MTDPRADRRAQIETAAYEVLATKGYARMTMRDLARGAKASNETLYNWYGDKQGLMRAMIVSNAAAVKAQLTGAFEAEAPPLESLKQIAPNLLGLLVSDRAIALNRAAAGDATGELGAALAELGRETIGPMIRDLMVRAVQRSELSGDPDALLNLFLSLLVGDRQIRRAIGTLPAMDQAQITRQAEIAMTQFLALTARGS